MVDAQAYETPASAALSIAVLTLVVHAPVLRTPLTVALGLDEADADDGGAVPARLFRPRPAPGCARRLPIPPWRDCPGGTRSLAPSRLPYAPGRRGTIVSLPDQALSWR